MQIIDKIAWIHLSDRKVLAARSRGKSKYYIPGGKRDNGEQDIETLVREVREELGVEIISGSAKYYGIFEAQADGKSEGVTVKVTCYTADFSGALRASSEIEEIAWLDSSDTDAVSPVNGLILTDLKGKSLIQ